MQVFCAWRKVKTCQLVKPTLLAGLGRQVPRLSQDLISGAESSAQAPVTQGCLGAGYVPSYPGSPTGGFPRSWRSKEGGDCPAGFRDGGRSGLSAHFPTPVSEAGRTEMLQILHRPLVAFQRRVCLLGLVHQHLQGWPRSPRTRSRASSTAHPTDSSHRPALPASATFLMEPLLLIQDDELAVLVGLLQHMLALFDVAVVVLQAQQGGHQGHVRLQRRRDFSGSASRRPRPSPARPASGRKARDLTKAETANNPLSGLQGVAFIAL